MTGAAPSRLQGRWPVVAAGVLAAAAVFVVWGSIAPVPVMHDEWAYWLQADQYAHLHWSVPSPPIPAFFEQFYVLVTPVFAAKYPPGHALVLAPGFALGAPALMPLLLTAVAGALVFALARRLSGTPTAFATWVLWLGTFGNLRFRASYFSELTTSCCWLVAWWALLEWRASRRRCWMAVLALAIGWGAITRPATMFVFALPVAVVVLGDVIAGKRWRDLATGLVLGALVLGLLPVWSAATTGSWRSSPLAVYTQQYLPFDMPGFRVNETAPERSLPPEMERVRTFLYDIKADQVGTPAWETLWDRAGILLRDSFAGWRLPFAIAFVVGLLSLGAAGWFAFGTSALLIVSYLTQAHTADWAIYYLETMPVIAYTAARGTREIVRRVRARGVGLHVPRWVPAVAAAGGALLLARDVIVAKGILDQVAAKPRAFRAAVSRLPKTPNVVFVHYAERRNMHIALVANRGVLDGTPSWIVHDRGDRDDRALLAAAPGRTGYVFDETTGEFREVRP